MQSLRLQNTIKALLLIGLGLFLYSRLMNGTLFYYINERFMGFTIVAVVGLLVIGLSYRYSNPDLRYAHGHDHVHDHEHTADQGHGPDGHSHALSWGGIFLVALPMILGILTPPQPLGAAALANRDMALQLNNTGQGVAGPSAARPREKAAIDKNILDWWRDFRTVPDANQALAGQAVKAIGFVYKDERYGKDTFVLTRFTVSCCAADASAVGLLVQSPESTQLTDDTWVEVSGTFVASDQEKWTLPIVAAQTVTRIDIPDQPYLYP
jgi:putative membrane protein